SAHSGPGQSAFTRRTSSAREAGRTSAGGLALALVPGEPADRGDLDPDAPLEPEQLLELRPFCSGQVARFDLRGDLADRLLVLDQLREAEADDRARRPAQILGPRILVDAQRHVRIGRDVAKVAAALPEAEEEAAVLPDVPDRRQVGPAVGAVRCEPADAELAEERVALRVRERVLPGRGRPVQERLRHQSSRIAAARTGEP